MRHLVPAVVLVGVSLPLALSCGVCNAFFCDDKCDRSGCDGNVKEICDSPCTESGCHEPKVIMREPCRSHETCVMQTNGIYPICVMDPPTKCEVSDATIVHCDGGLRFTCAGDYMQVADCDESPQMVICDRVCAP